MMSVTINDVCMDATALVAKAHAVLDTRVAPRAVRLALYAVNGSLESAVIGLRAAYGSCESCLKGGNFEGLASAATQAQAAIRAVDESTKAVKALLAAFD